MADLTVNSGAMPFTFSLGGGGGTIDTDGHAAAVSGVISGSGGLSKSGSGTLTLSGVNSYTGGTTVTGGTLALNSTSGDDCVIRGTLTVNSAGTVLVGGNDWIGLGNDAAARVTTLNVVGGTVNNTKNTSWIRGAAVNLTGGSMTGGEYHWNSSSLNSLASDTTATFGSNLHIRKDSGSSDLTVDVADGTAATDLLISGQIKQTGGTAAVTKTGAGVLRLSGYNNYTGATTVSDGTLIVDGSISTSMTTVESGATLGGSGTVGSLTVASGAYLNPGNSPGILTVDGDYTQSGTLGIEINGVTAGSLHDQVNVDRTSGDGAVSLSGDLSVLFGGGYVPASGDLIFILLNDGSDAISGNFTGLAQDDIVTSYGGYDWRISYGADSGTNSFTGGNDIALLAVPEPGAAHLVGVLCLLTLLRRRRAA